MARRWWLVGLLAALLLGGMWRLACLRAEFWLDEKGRLVRVLVSYATPKGGEITVDGAFTEAGTKVDVTPPPTRDIETVSSATG